MYKSKKQNNKEKGITLIALIITIIILLILAGITINILIGDNGLFKTAKESTDSYIKAGMKEKLELAIADFYAQKLENASLNDITQEWINERILDYECKISEYTPTNVKFVIMKKDGITGVFIIDEALNITESIGKLGYVYNIVKKEESNIKISISMFDDRGITEIKLPNQNSVRYNEEKIIEGIETTVRNGEEYTIKVTLVGGKEEEIKILISEYYKVTKKLANGLTINNTVEKVLGGSTYEATIEPSNTSQYYLDTLNVTMGGTTVNIGTTTGKIKITNVTGDIEITATCGQGRALIGSGTLLDSSYQLGNCTTAAYLKQKDGYVECRLDLAKNDYRSTIILEY